jgi:N-acetylneuraminic acid mutarotase
MAMLNLETLCWETVEAFGRKPIGRWGHSSVTFGNKLIVFGGINHNAYCSNDIHCLETD